MHVLWPGLCSVRPAHAVHERVVVLLLLLWAPFLACSVVAGAGEVTVDLRFSPDAVHITREGEYDAVDLKGGNLPEDAPGSPWLPARFVNVVIPAGSRAIDVRADVTEVVHRRDVFIRPVQPPQPFSRPARPLVTHDARAYADEARVPSAVVVLGNTHRLHGYALVSVRVNPLRWIPATRELFLATRVRLFFV